jgi:hypothetical protein
MAVFVLSNLLNEGRVGAVRPASSMARHCRGLPAGAGSALNPLSLILEWRWGGLARPARCFAAGQAVANAILMRRTLTVTTAPIFNSFSRIRCWN